jgi:hypothetical protein
MSYVLMKILIMNEECNVELQLNKSSLRKEMLFELRKKLLHLFRTYRVKTNDTTVNT